MNVALGKPTTQSSTFPSAFPSLAVDGNTSPNFGVGSCTATNNEMQPWWQVDLGMEYNIFAVDLVNRDTWGE